MALFIALWVMNSGPELKRAVSGYFKDPRGYTVRLGAGPAGSGESLKVTRANVSEIQSEIERALRAAPEFQRIGRTMLIAAGLPPESLLVRDASRPGWKRGLEATIGVVCDAATAAELPKACHPLIFTLLGEQAFNHLRKMEAALTNADSSAAAD